MSERTAYTALIEDIKGVLRGTTDSAIAAEQIAHTLVPTLGDWCVINLFDPELGIRRAASHHADPAMQDVMTQLRERYAVRRSGDVGVTQVLRTGEPLMVPEVDDGYIQRVAIDARHAELLRMLRPRSAMYVPMAVAGSTIGVLTLGASGREYGELDRQLAVAVANHTGLLLENLRLSREVHDHQAQRRRAESDLETQGRSFRALFHANPLPMWVYDLATLRFLEVNDAASSVYGWTHDEFLRMTILDIRPQADALRMLEEVRRDQSAVTDWGTWQHLKRDGTIISAHVRSHELNYSGRRAVLAVAEDVTEQVHTRAALQELNIELERRVAERTAELEAANQELESFSYSVSHDLRGPLRSIDGFSQALVEDYSDALDSNALDYLRRIRAAAQRMGGLIDDLLRLARVTRNELRHTDVNLATLAQDVVATLREQDPARAVEVRIAEPLPARGDAHLLGIAMENLLSNAWKFTSREPEAAVEVGALDQDGETVYFVRDNGAGFDMAYVHKLFGVFQRLHSPRDYEGTGVGLAIVHRVLTRHGGRVWAEAAPNDGATFYFTLP